MPRYQCCACERTETLAFTPTACSSCGNGTLIDLDTAEAEAQRAAVIAQQNDRFRTAWPTTAAGDREGRLVFTRGVADLGSETAGRIMVAVQAFDTFTEDNDPHGHHDFGVFEIDHEGAKVRLYWKIDLYDLAYEYGSEQPDNPGKTRRVLTVLLPSEY